MTTLLLLIRFRCAALLIHMVVTRKEDSLDGCSYVNDEREQQCQMHGHGIEFECEHVFVL